MHIKKGIGEMPYEHIPHELKKPFKKLFTKLPIIKLLHRLKRQKDNREVVKE